MIMKENMNWLPKN